MENDVFIKHLRQQLLHPLPGTAAHMRMMPANRAPVSQLKIDDTIRFGAILILLFNKENHWHTVLMKRPVYNGIHSGQISFPGGKKEECDETLEQTALREAAEETGGNNKQIEILGKLTEVYIPPSRFVVHPYIGYVPAMPDFKPNQREVEKLFVVNLRELFLPQNSRHEKIRLSNGLLINTPCFKWQGEIIWGATAMILSELQEVMHL